MRAAWREADRAAELLTAARGWRAAGLIDEATQAAIVAGRPASGPRLGSVWRVLVFLCVWVGVSAATTISLFSTGLREPFAIGLLLAVLGTALAVATDVILDRCAFQATGAEAATSLIAATYLCVAVFALLEGPHLAEHQRLSLLFPWCAAVFGLASWRWGFALYAAPATVFALLWSAQYPGARLLWMALAALIAAAASLALARRELAPSHRAGLEVARLVALAAIYVAVNYLSCDKSWIEEIGRIAGAPHQRAGTVGLTFALLGSALYPPAILAWGLLERQRALIALGVVAGALSLTTIRFYFHVAPLWVVLIAAGAALAVGSLLLERWLRLGPDGERRGFTAAALYDEARRERLLKLAAALAAAPAARALPERPAGLTGQGGGFGGGGAAGTW